MHIIILVYIYIHRYRMYANGTGYTKIGTCVSEHASTQASKQASKQAAK